MNEPNLSEILESFRIFLRINLSLISLKYNKVCLVSVPTHFRSDI